MVPASLGLNLPKYPENYICPFCIIKTGMMSTSQEAPLKKRRHACKSLCFFLFYGRNILFNQS
jgi:hypothetical protein